MSVALSPVTEEQMRAYLALKAAFERLAPIFVGATPAARLDALPADCTAIQTLLLDLKINSIRANARRNRL